MRLGLKDWKISQAGTSIEGFPLFPKAGLKTASRNGKTAASSQLFWGTSIKSVCGGAGGLQRERILLSSHLQGCSPSTLDGKSSTEQGLDRVAFICIPEDQGVSGITADQNGPLFLAARFLLCATYQKRWLLFCSFWLSPVLQDLWRRCESAGNPLHRHPGPAISATLSLPVCLLQASSADAVPHQAVSELVHLHLERGEPKVTGSGGGL